MAAPLLIITSSGLIGLFLSLFSLWGLSLIGLAGIFLVLFLKKIPATPPHVGLVIIWGERKPKIKKEGWRLVAPFFPFMYDVIFVNVEKKNRDFQPKNVRTKRQAELEMRISLTWAPDKEDGKNLLEYINVGGKEGVENVLDDIVEQECREFAIDEEWEECLRASEVIIKRLIKEITGEEDVAAVREIRRGNGMAKIPSLGIVLNRLNIGTIWVKGKLGEEAERISYEERQRESEKVEIRHIRERMKELQELGFSAKDAAEIVQTERGKVKKEIHEIKGIDLEGLGRGLGEIFKKKR
jgi:regulator of protease activity HflC (stomatin/prohibitin superfamily)